MTCLAISRSATTSPGLEMRMRIEFMKSPHRRGSLILAGTIASLLRRSQVVATDAGGRHHPDQHPKESTADRVTHEMVVQANQREDYRPAGQRMRCRPLCPHFPGD